MSEWDDGYVAAALHDLKKMLLSASRNDRRGTWADHEKLGDLKGSLDPGDAPRSRRFSAAFGADLNLHLETKDQLELIHGHGGVKQVSRPGLAAPLLALQFADRAHKALYFREEGGGEVTGVNWHCPWYYPFWGERKEWGIEQAQDQFLDVATEIQDRAKGGVGKLDAQFLVEQIGEKYLRAFGDSTFLPVTSLHFHHQLTAAIYLMVMKQFHEDGGVQAFTDAKGNLVPAIPLPLTLTVISLPAERLRYRLRDAMHLRKISQHLLLELHRYLKDTYLSEPDLAKRQFRHPRLSPFVFYGKEAIVLLNRQKDDAEILKIAQQVADETDAPFRIQRHRVRLAPARPTAPPYARVPADQLIGQSLGRIEPGAPETDTAWALLRTSHVTDASHQCAVCQKPIPAGQQTRDTDTEEDLCRVCHALRFAYRQCASPECRALFPRADASERCPLCRGEARYPDASGKVIADLEGERLAIFVLRIGVTPGDMAVESELRLAQFREERLAREKAILEGCGLGPSQVTVELSRATDRTPLVHGTGGILEYLQAVLEIGRKQEQWRTEIERWQGALEETKTIARFVYLSPAFTVLLIHEKLSSRAYARISADLNELHLAHRLDVVMCDGHYPVYDALSPLFDGPGRGLRTVGRDRSTVSAARVYLQKMGPVYKRWLVDRRAAPERNAGYAELQVAAAALAEPSHRNPDRGLALRVIRGGIERVFTDELARQVLTAQPSKDSTAQLHALASLADSLAAVAPDDDSSAAMATLRMDLDARELKLTDSGRSAVSHAINEVEAGKMSPAILAHYLRELARTTKTE